MIYQPNFRRIAPNRPFLTPRKIVEPHNMRLNLIENRFHAKFYVNQLFRKRNLIFFFGKARNSLKNQERPEPHTKEQNTRRKNKTIKSYDF